MEEHARWLDRLAELLQGALDHFGVALRDGVTVTDLATACASMIEGVWLNQCMTRRHPADAEEPIATALRRSRRLIWRGATQGG